MTATGLHVHAAPGVRRIVATTPAGGVVRVGATAATGSHGNPPAGVGDVRTTTGVRAPTIGAARGRGARRCPRVGAATVGCRSGATALATVRLPLVGGERGAVELVPFAATFGH
jgi:hypothetical protein